MVGSYPLSTMKSFALSVSSIATSCTFICSRRRFISRSTICLISSFVSFWNTMISSIRFRSSGRNIFFTSPMMRFFMSS